MSLKLETRTVPPTETGSDRFDFAKECPQFFTAKVVANREAKPVRESPFSEPKPYCHPVARKLNMGGSRKENVMLHLDPKDHSFYLKCPEATCEKMRIERAAIQEALAAAHTDEWVRLKVGVEVYRLNRAELRAAFRTLETTASES